MEFTDINIIQQSIHETNTMYIGTDEGLIILDKDCAIPPTSVPEIKLQNLVNFYPIPSQSILNIDSTIDIEVIRFYDAAGRLVLEKYNPNKQMNIDLLTPSIYTVFIKSEDIRITKKIMVSK